MNMRAANYRMIAMLFKKLNSWQNNEHFEIPISHKQQIIFNIFKWIVVAPSNSPFHELAARGTSTNQIAASWAL